MMKWLKRIRGAVGTALTWAAGWSVVGAIFWAVTVVLGGEPTIAGFVVSGWVVAASYATAGFIGGGIFSTVLGLVEGRRRFDQMSLPRFAAWGALGGLLLSMFLIATGAVTGPVQVFGLGVVTLLSAGSASGSLALARRADDRQLLGDGTNVADIGLTKEERVELLGE